MTQFRSGPVPMFMVVSSGGVGKPAKVDFYTTFVEGAVAAERIEGSLLYEMQLTPVFPREDGRYIRSV